MTTTLKTESRASVITHAGPTHIFDQIEHPGCYVTNDSGLLLRVPQDALGRGRSPLMDVVSNEPWIVTKISEDPYLPLSKARLASADLDIKIHF